MDRRIDVGEQARRVVGGAAEHGAIDMAQMLDGLIQRLNAAIDADESIRNFALSR